MNKLKAVILGSTGAAGQNIVESLENHPWFAIDTLAASSRSSNLTYKEAIKEAIFFDKTPSDKILGKNVLDVRSLSGKDYDIAFSALPSDIAKELEPKFAAHIPVISTASAYRYERDIPILIPEVNPTHTKLIKLQRENRGWEGFICPGPNCTTVGLVMSLKPIHDKYGIRAVHMVSEQALSGAGEKGLRADSEYRKSVELNVLPYIEGEEEKVAKETRKILGKMRGNSISEAKIALNSTCTRVHVQNVHTEAVYIDTIKNNEIEEIKATMKNFEGEPQRMSLPSAPKKPIMVLDDPYQPQPRLHSNYDGSVTLVGRLRRDPVFKNGVAYVITSDNTDRGAGGGAVLVAEYLKAKKYF